MLCKAERWRRKWGLRGLADEVNWTITKQAPRAEETPQ